MNKAWKITIGVIAGLLIFIILVLGFYLIYLTCQYYRIEDHQLLTVNDNQSALLETNTEYSISTYNIGFCAYDPGFTFFMDEGEMLDGTKTKGSGSRAASTSSVLTNLSGVTETMKNLSPDFMLFQEVDTDSYRTYYTNQYESMNNSFTGMKYSDSYASNFHSAFLFYPIFDPHGTVNAGITTYSRYKINSCERRSFPIDESFPNKYFDLDRCFQVNRLSVGDKELVLINLHMSAYDEGGKIRKLQLDMLTDYVQEEYAKGNYVIAGGDFNHDIANSVGLGKTNPFFETQQKIPPWLAQITAEDIPQGFSFAAGTNVPSCRSSDIPWEKGKNFVVTIDGFLVSDNVSITDIRNIDTNFQFSDHNPSQMKFKLLP